MVITPSISIINGIEVRHAYDYKCHWIVATDIAKAMGIGTSTLMKFVTPQDDSACQILVGTGRTIPPPKAIALRSDILTDAIANLIQNQRWQKTYATKRQFRDSIAKVRAFLQELTRNSIETRDTTITR
jgi:hypothetical protein